MIASMEVLLPIGAFAFYLVDSAVLLYANEVVLTRCDRRWRIFDGFELTLANRRPYIPNALRPDQLMIRTTWSLNSLEQIEARDDLFEQLNRHLRPQKIIVIALLVTLLIILPLTSVAFGAGRALLAVFGFFYFCVASMLVVTYWNRNELHDFLGLDPPDFL